MALELVLPHIVDQQNFKQKGLRRLTSALGHQYAGARHALVNDSAVRQVGAAVVVLLFVSALLRVGPLEHLLLAVATVQVLIVEVLNSAIEAAVDRISQEHHPLAKVAKDLGSVAVGLAVLSAGLCWIVIAGPIALSWVARP